MPLLTPACLETMLPVLEQESGADVVRIFPQFFLPSRAPETLRPRQGPTTRRPQGQGGLFLLFS